MKRRTRRYLNSVQQLPLQQRAQQESLLDLAARLLFATPQKTRNLASRRVNVARAHRRFKNSH